MELISLTLISGMAAGFIIEIISVVFSRFIPNTVIRGVLVLPLTGAAAWLLKVPFPEFYPVVLAASFFSLVVLRWLNKPITITNYRR